MDIDKIVRSRHSVRKYLSKSIEEDKVKEINNMIDKINKENDLNFQLILNERDAFAKFCLNYGKLNASNYIALVGKDNSDLDEKIGYYGEMLVIKAQELGLNTCWVTGSYSKREVKAIINNKEKLVGVIAIGYGETQGLKRKSKKYSEVSYTNEAPDWYKKGVEYSLLGPSAMNQQKFKFELLDNNKVRITPGVGLINTKIDMGIAKYQFELGAGKENFTWDN